VWRKSHKKNSKGYEGRKHTEEEESSEENGKDKMGKDEGGEIKPTGEKTWTCS